MKCISQFHKIPNIATRLFGKNSVNPITVKSYDTLQKYIQFRVHILGYSSLLFFEHIDTALNSNLNLTGIILSLRWNFTFTTYTTFY